MIDTSFHGPLKVQTAAQTLAMGVDINVPSAMLTLQNTHPSRLSLAHPLFRFAPESASTAVASGGTS